jgi:hypothetical protein
VCASALTAPAAWNTIARLQEIIMNTTRESIRQSTFRNFVIEATAVQIGSQWRPQFRVTRGNRKTNWCTPRVHAFSDSALAIDAAMQQAVREIKRGWGSCFA